MKNVITYSGIAVKVRAMQKELLTEAEFRKLAEFRLSMQKAEYLSGFKPYHELFQNASDENMHRSGVERRLRLSLFRDFDKLYKFANVKQKRFLKLYFEHFEVRMVKECLEAVMSGHPSEFEFMLYEEFIRRYAKIDIMKLAQSSGLYEFIENLSATPYYSILKRLYESGQAGAADYETAIDMRYFTTMWRLKDKVLSNAERQVMEKTFGSRIDLLNISWIYRSKKYYSLTPQEIYNLLIPVHYKIRAEELKKLVETPGLPEFQAAERESYYGAVIKKGVDENGSLFETITELLRHIYKREAKNHPYSIAPLNTYFYLKEKEIERIIYIIERTHYKDENGTAATAPAGEVSA